jgi:glycosyltransferase involved in cell wall biosynthesis
VRILFVTNEYPPLTSTGGIGTYVAETAPALVRLGHEVHAVVCRRDVTTADPMVDGVHVHLRTLRVRLDPLAPLRPRLTLRRSLAAAARTAVADLGRFDVVEFADWSAHGHDLPRTQIPRRVAHLHTSLAAAATFERAANPLDLRACRAWEAAAVAGADVAASPSQAILDLSLAAGLRPPPTTVIPIGIDTTRFTASALPSGPPRLLVAGRLIARKRADLVLEAITPLDLPTGTTVVLAGGTTQDRRGEQYTARLHELAAASGVEVEFLGHVSADRMDAEYRASTAVIIPSDFESYSLVALEALVRGRPVIATEGVGATEFISDVATVIPIKDPVVLGQAIDDLVNADDLAERAAAGRELVLRDLDVTELAKRRLALYEP